MTEIGAIGYQPSLSEMSPEARVAMERAALLGYSVEAAICYCSGGNSNAVYSQIGAEVGISSEANISLEHSISSDEDDDILFQGEDGILYDFDFTNDRFSSQSEVDFAKENGMITEDDKFYDVMDFSSSGIEFIDYTFQGTGDGIANKTSVAVSSSSKWASKTSWVRQEVDINAMGRVGNDNVTTTSNREMERMIDNARQWLTDKDIEEINKYKTYSQQFIALKRIILKRMDETGKAQLVEDKK